MLGRPNVLNHLSIPAACFTHPEVSFVGVTQDKAEEMAKEQGFKLGVAKTSFKANSKVRAGSFADTPLHTLLLNVVVSGGGHVQGVQMLSSVCQLACSD